MDSLNAFNSHYGFFVVPKKEFEQALAELPFEERKAAKQQAKAVITSLNFMKVASYLPIIGTIVYAIALAKAKNSVMEKNERAAFVARAIISLIPGLGLALLPVDLFATAVTFPIMKNNKKKQEAEQKKQEELKQAQYWKKPVTDWEPGPAPGAPHAYSSETARTGGIHSERFSKNKNGNVEYESYHQGKAKLERRE